MRLPTAIAASVALHGTVALWWATRGEPSQAAQRPAPPATQVALFEVVEQQRPAASAAPAPVVAGTRGRARRTPASAAPRTESPLPERGEGQGQGVSTQGEAGPAEQGPQAVDAPAAPSPAAAAPAFDPAALHAALAESARRCYPAAAKRWNLTGEAVVAFCLDAAGALAKTQLEHSSGQELLDAAATDCVVVGALPFPREASGGCYSVPVRFGR